MTRSKRALDLSATGAAQEAITEANAALANAEEAVARAREALAQVPMASEPRRWLSIAEAAVALGLSRETLYECVRRGQLTVVRVGRAVRIPVAELDQFEQARLRESHG